MIHVVWGDELRKDYERLFNVCRVNPDKIASAKDIARKIATNRTIYQSVASKVRPGMPWWFIGVVHNLECGLSFQKHLHNGDPLGKKTTHVPKGRPLGNPPWTWEASALDALINVMGYGKVSDWSIAHILYMLEGYNGYGYRQYHPGVNSPYLWSGSNLYTKGKYSSDGHYDPELVSAQMGAACVIRALVDLKLTD